MPTPTPTPTPRPTTAQEVTVDELGYAHVCAECGADAPDGWCRLHPTAQVQTVDLP